MPMPPMWEEMTVADVVSNIFVESATFVMVFFLGALVGSFVNVVLFRMPRQLNLWWPPSHCPSCGNQLKLVDNIPIVSWLRLRGKCRYCGTAIPRSYLRVEVGFRLMFLVLMYLEIHTGGLNLPLRAPNHYVGALWTIWFPNPEMLRIYVYHVLLACFLATLLLFARRGERFPGSFIIVAWLFGTLIPLRYVGIQQVPLASLNHSGSEAWRSAGALEALLGIAMGLVGGVALGSVWPSRCVRGTPPTAWLAFPSRLDLAVVLSITGAWLGWQAVASVAVFTTLGGMLFPRSQAVTLAVCSVAFQLVAWRLMTKYLTWWPSAHTSPILIAGWVVVAIAIAFVQRSRLTADEIESSTSETPTAERLPTSGKDRTEPGIPEVDLGADNGTRNLA
jgi:prepilin signal peptidase PulO-like enzyme (type II secretory pathway)